MALITIGSKLYRDLETHGSLGVYVPLEGGFEGRYRRRLRSRGYVSVMLSARGLGDVAMTLSGVHGVRPPHLGKKSATADPAVGFEITIKLTADCDECHRVVPLTVCDRSFQLAALYQSLV